LALPRIVLTGARGYLGRALARRLAGERLALRLVSRPGFGLPETRALAGNIEYVTANLQEQENWWDLIGDADAVVHLSARTDLQAAEADPAGDEKLNVEPVRALIRAVARRRRTKPLVLFASTTSIVGIRHENPVHELTPDNPVSVYDRHKLLCEHLLLDATACGLIRACSLRLANVYGFGAASMNVNRGIFNAMIRRAARGKPILIFGDGQYLRDFIHVQDVVEAFCCALACERVQDGQHYVIASGKGMTLVDAFALVACEAGKITGRSVDLWHVPEPADLQSIERRNFIGDSTLFRTKTGWMAHIDLKTGIRRTLQEFLANR
jgi:nucleoside-diphosphate-sugar epimerase